MHGVQQKKAKEFSFSKISETVAFWLKDFSKKALLIAFGDGQREYFGKKGMSLHIDFFFTKQNGKIRKRVYYSSVYRCDQGIP